MKNKSIFKTPINSSHKWGSILLVVIIMTSGLFIFMPPILKISTAEDAPTTTEKYDNDFINGTLTNLTIIGGLNKELRLNYLESFKWNLQTLTTKPRARYEHALAQIYGTDKVLLFGGWVGSGPHDFNNTWIYDLSDNTWTIKTPNVSPKPVEQHAMASIWGDDKVLLFGGNMNGITNETWVYDLSENNWTKKGLQNKPPARNWHAMVSIDGTDKVVLFGGYSGSSSFNDTWIYDLSDNIWTQHFFSNTPSKRQLHTMASVYGDDKVVLYGGNTQAPGFNNETWVYDLSENNWTNRTPPNMASNPPGRMYHAMASIYGASKVIIFGGVSNTGYLNDTWIFNLNNNTWKEIELIQKPEENIVHRMASIYMSNKILLFGGKINGGAIVNNTWILTTYKYLRNGTYISAPYHIKANSIFKTLSRNTTTPSNTSIKLQIRTGLTQGDLLNRTFIGPTGNSFSFYTSSLSDIWFGHNGDSWVQIKAYFSTSNIAISPILRNVTILYNILPNTTLINPINGTITNNDKPIFEWDFLDLDSINQSAFHLILDDDIAFDSINYDSDEQTSGNYSWQFPNGTNYLKLSEGIWYWKVKTKDNDGDWGPYSEPWRFIVDTIAPTSKIVYPANNKFYNNIYSISGAASDSTNGTGLDKIELSIHRKTDNSYYDGMSWIDSETWLPVSGTSEWSFNSSSIIWFSDWEYQVKSRAIDGAFNFETPMAGNTYIYDCENVIYSNALPLPGEIFNEKKVEVGITISDMISGVNASTIEYSISTDEGKTWSSWLEVFGLQNNQSINVKLNLTFPNGTDNRIKWRASDVAGNGPTESKGYVIKVNTSLQKLLPQVELINPRNGSIISITSVELSWSAVNQNFPNVTYDVYFDSVLPVAPNMTGVLDTSLWINNLVDGKTYYWTVVPRSDELIGFCRSGIWSFTVNTSVPVPRVNLIRPENGSILSSQMPTFVWSVEYESPEIITYDIYLSPEKSPEPKLTGYDESYYSFENLLEYNTTYYWKVVPWAGNIQGPASETWSFTIKKDYLPQLQLRLIIDPSMIVLVPGNTSQVRAIVTNLGEIMDSITVSLEIPPESGVDAVVNDPNTREISSEGFAVFNISVSTSFDVEAGEVNLTVVATSDKAPKYGLTVEERAELKVIIYVDEDEVPGHSKSSSTFLYWKIMVIAIMIIVILTLLFYILKKHKKHQDEVEEGQPLEDIATIEPETATKPEIETTFISAVAKAEQLPKETTVEEASTPVLAIETSPRLPQTANQVPTLVSPITPGQVPETQQIPQVTPVPQLPSAQPETAETIEESTEETPPESDRSIDIQLETDQNSQEKN